MASFSLTNYVKNSYAELRKVTWPTRAEGIQSTVTVVVFSVVVAILLGAIDFLLTTGFNYLITLAQ